MHDHAHRKHLNDEFAYEFIGFGAGFWQDGDGGDSDDDGDVRTCL